MASDGVTRFDLQGIYNTPSAKHQRWGRMGLQIVALVGAASVASGWVLHFAAGSNSELVQQIAESMVGGGLAPLVIGGVFSQFVLKPDAVAVDVDREGLCFIQPSGKEDRLRWDSKGVSIYLTDYPSTEGDAGTSSGRGGRCYVVASRTRTFLTGEARDCIVSVATELGLDVTTGPAARVRGATTTHITGRPAS